VAVQLLYTFTVPVTFQGAVKQVVTLMVALTQLAEPQAFLATTV